MMKKKILALLLGISMLLSFVPANAAKNKGYRFPVDSYTKITWYFGIKGHTGIDISAPLETPIYATKSGTIIKKHTGCNNYSRGNGAITTCENYGVCNPIHGYSRASLMYGYCNDGFGNGYIIKHDDGTWSAYGHMNYLPEGLTEGQHIEQGTYLGGISSTGNSSGPHLHFEMRTGNSNDFWSATPINPFDYMDDDDRGDTPTPISSGKTSIPVVKLSGKNVTVEWDYPGNATSFDVYLLQEPCGWEDIKYRSLNHSASERSYTFSNVTEGAYYAFVIARPNADDVQSGWSPFKVVNNGVALNYWGEDIKRLQETLNGMTGTKLGTDGWYGPNTEKAVKAYQKEKGLTVDGWYGASTKAALEDEVKTMQNMLNAVTGTSLGADGWFGPNTQKAVKAYQQKKGLTVDGWYGGITKAALEADYNDLTLVSSSAPTSAPISTPSEAVEPEIPEQPSIGESTPDTANKDDGSSSVLTVYGGDTLQIAVDDRMADFGDAQPFIDANDRTQVPIRAVSELLDCTVDWDPITRSATITRGNGDTIVIAIGSVEMTVNGSKVTMDTAALIANDRTYIPLRCVAEAFGLTVDWI